MNSSFPFSSPSRERLLALIERLNNEGSLSEPEHRELENLLSASEEARKIFVLRQELDAMLSADKSIRLRLASDLFPENVVLMPGATPAVASRPLAAPSARLLRRSAQPAAPFRMSTLLAAAIAGFIGLLFIYQRSEDLAKAFVRLDRSLAGGEVSYQHDVLPILAAHCLECHGPDESRRKAGLRLDIPLPAGSGENPVIVKGAPEKSELIARIRSADPDFQMPPPDSGKERLTPREVETLATWVRQGARHSLASPLKKTAARAAPSSLRLVRLSR